MICKNCGAQTEGNFCNNCGAPLPKEVASSAAIAAQKL